MSERFSGFSEKTVDFLFALPFENTQEQKETNLQRYKTLISAPLSLLYEELKPVAERICPALDTRSSHCLSSPYTDRRFTEKPIKEYMYLRFRENKAHDMAGLYFDMGADYYSYGLRIYKQTAQGFGEMKQTFAQAPERANRMLENIRNAGYDFKGESYRHDRFPDMPENALKKLCNMKSVSFTKEIPINERCFSHALAEELINGFLAFGELFDMLPNLF